MKNHQLLKAFKLFKENEIDFQDCTEEEKFDLLKIILKYNIKYEAHNHGK